MGEVLALPWSASAPTRLDDLAGRLDQLHQVIVGARCEAERMRGYEPKLRPLPDGRFAEVLPKTCERGHTLLPGWQPCRCGGHRALDCIECDTTDLLPEPGPGCGQLHLMAPDGKLTY